MLSKSGSYWANACECLRWAEEAKSEANREALIEMAKFWTQLAFEKGLTSVPTADDRKMLDGPLGAGALYIRAAPPLAPPIKAKEQAKRRRSQAPRRRITAS